MLRALLLRAQFHAGQGQTETALEDLRQALRLAEPEGYLGSFVDEGPAVAALLARALQPDGPVPDVPAAYIKNLLAAFPPGALAVSAPAPQQPGLVEPLTERELEVLHLIADVLKYEEIASRLFITVNTVRFYVKEIYSKLAVNNRTKAIEVALQLNLL